MKFFLKFILLGAIIMAQHCESKEYRASIHAGTWYPSEAKELETMLQHFLEKVKYHFHGCKT